MESYDPSIAIFSLAFIILLFGAIYGSYCSKVTYRLSGHHHIKGKNYFSASYCPSCGKKILLKDKVPIISYYNLNGKCRKCHSKIPKEDLIIEICGVILPFFFLWYDNLSLISLFDYLIAMTLISDFFIYQQLQQFPMILSFYLFALGILLNIFNGYIFINAFLGIAVAILITIIYRILRKNKDFLENAFLFCALGVIFDWIGLIVLISLFFLLYLIYRIADYFIVVPVKEGSLLMIAALINLLFNDTFQIIFTNIVIFLTH